MKIINELSNTKIKFDTALTIGTFDGVHQGHMELVKKVLALSKKNELKSCVLAFQNKLKNNERILSIEDKLEKIKKTGIDILFNIEIDDKIKSMQPIEFIKNILIDKLNVKILVVGYNFKFGYKRKGDIKLLKKFESENDNFKVLIIDKVKIENRIVSTTEIKKLLKKGDIENVNKLLGYEYCITGKVIKGKAFGRTIGFPTANIQTKKYLFLPKGIFYGKIIICGMNKYHKCAIFIDCKKTSSDIKNVLECYILDFDKNIYDKICKVFLTVKIRDVIKFNNALNLKKQISEDISYIKNTLLSN